MSSHIQTLKRRMSHNYKLIPNLEQQSQQEDPPQQSNKSRKMVAHPLLRTHVIRKLILIDPILRLMLVSYSIKFNYLRKSIRNNNSSSSNNSFWMMKLKIQVILWTNKEKATWLFKDPKFKMRTSSRLYQACVDPMVRQPKFIPNLKCSKKSALMVKIITENNNLTSSTS